MLLDSLFISVYWIAESNNKGFSSFFKSVHYKELFFIYLTIILLYMSFSAARVWKRANPRKNLYLTSGPIDYLLTFMLAINSIIFLVVGILDIQHEDMFGYYFVIGSIIMLLFVVFDMYTFLKKPLLSKHKSWIHHMVKITCAWAGLLDAFWIRINPILIEMGFEIFAKIHFGTSSWILLIFIGFIGHRKKLNRVSFRS